MRVVRPDEPTPPALRGAVVALGNFDGVHRGHRQLVALARDAARAGGRPAAILFFDPHPRAFFAPDTPHFRLTSEAGKLKMLKALDLDGVFVRRFDAALAAMPPAEFITRIIAAELGASGLVVGPDFHFGRGREGTPALLAALAAENGIACRIAPAVTVGGAQVSSSAVRAALADGRIEDANRLLGYRWFVEGEVRHGDKRGRLLGFPTANLALDPGCGLRHGIYAVRVAIAPGLVHDGVASFGRRPTFDNGAPLLEIFLFDFSGDLYGRRVECEFVSWIRAEEHFSSAEALIARMNQDRDEARRLLGQAEADGLPSFIG